MDPFKSWYNICDNFIPPPLDVSKEPSYHTAKCVLKCKTVAALYFSWKIITNG